MCWSAEADTVAGLTISAAGIVCLARVRDPRRLPLAALPLLLGVHQLIEAAVWLGADGRLPSGPAEWARTAWAVIALPLLPALVPVGVWLASPARTRRRQAVLAAVGLTVAAILTAVLLTHPVGASVHHHTLTYGIGIPAGAALLVGYLLATVGSLLAADDRTLRLLGVLMGAGALVCTVLWRLAFVSTWCALAALAATVLLPWAGRTDPPRAALP